MLTSSTKVILGVASPFILTLGGIGWRSSCADKNVPDAIASFLTALLGGAALFLAVNY